MGAFYNIANAPNRVPNGNMSRGLAHWRIPSGTHAHRRVSELPPADADAPLYAARVPVDGSANCDLLGAAIGGYQVPSVISGVKAYVTRYDSVRQAATYVMSSIPGQVTSIVGKTYQMGSIRPLVRVGTDAYSVDAVPVDSVLALRALPPSWAAGAILAVHAFNRTTLAYEGTVNITLTAVREIGVDDGLPDYRGWYMTATGGNGLSTSSLLYAGAQAVLPPSAHSEFYVTGDPDDINGRWTFGVSQAVTTLYTGDTASAARILTQARPQESAPFYASHDSHGAVAYSRVGNDITVTIPGIVPSGETITPIGGGTPVDIGPQPGHSFITPTYVGLVVDAYVSGGNTTLVLRNFSAFSVPFPADVAGTATSWWLFRAVDLVVTRALPTVRYDVTVAVRNGGDIFRPHAVFLDDFGRVVGHLDYVSGDTVALAARRLMHLTGETQSPFQGKPVLVLHNISGVVSDLAEVRVVRGWKPVLIAENNPDTADTTTIDPLRGAVAQDTAVSLQGAIVAFAGQGCPSGWKPMTALPDSSTGLDAAVVALPSPSFAAEYRPETESSDGPFKLGLAEWRTEVGFPFDTSPYVQHRVGGGTDPYQSPATKRDFVQFAAGTALVTIERDTGGQLSQPIKAFVAVDVTHVQDDDTYGARFRVRVAGQRAAEILALSAAGWKFYVVRGEYLRHLGTSTVTTLGAGQGDHTHALLQSDLEQADVTLASGLFGVTLGLIGRHTHGQLGHAIQNLPVSAGVVLCQKL